VLAASYFYYPQSLDGPVLCYFKLLMGIPCMGCGLTRAFCHLAHLDLGQAIRYNIVAPLLMLYFAVWYAFAMVRQFREWQPPRWWSHCGKAVLLLFAIFYCGRMVEFFSSPEGLLSPLKHNVSVRLIRWDWGNTYESW
jgi:hypothetical protein